MTNREQLILTLTLLECMKNTIMLNEKISLSIFINVDKIWDKERIVLGCNDGSEKDLEYFMDKINHLDFRYEELYQDKDLGILYEVEYYG